jgi:hypothetical protein
MVIFAPLTGPRVLPLHLGQAIFGAAATRRLIVFAPVAQLDRAPGYEPGGRGFESLRAHHLIKNLRALNEPTVAKT